MIRGGGDPAPAPDPARAGGGRAEDRALVRRALEVAAGTPGEDVPVGAIVVGPDGRELAAATNRREADGDPLAHAEVLALRGAARALGDGWRLEDCLADLGAARDSLASTGTLGPLVDEGHRARLAYEAARPAGGGDAPGGRAAVTVTPGAPGWLEALREAGSAGREVRPAG